MPTSLSARASDAPADSAGRAASPRGRLRLHTAGTAAAVVMALVMAGLSWGIGGAFLGILSLGTEARTVIVPRINKQQEYAVFAARMGQLAEAVLSSRSATARANALAEAEKLATRFAEGADSDLLQALDDALHAVRRTASRTNAIEAQAMRIAAVRAQADAVFLRILGSATALAAQEPFFRVVEVLSEASAAPTLERLDVLEERLRELSATVRIALAASEGPTLQRFYEDLDGLEVLFALRREMLANETLASGDIERTHALLGELTAALTANAASGAYRIADTLAEHAERGMMVVALGLAAAGLVQLAIVLTLRGHVVAPILRAAQALVQVQRERRSVRLPPALFAEIDAITSGVERFGEALVETHEAAEALRAGEERLRSILHASPFPIVITRVSDGSVLFFNSHAERLFGASGMQLTLTRDARFFDDPADADRLLRLLEERKAASEVEMRLKTAIGRPFWALVSAVEIRDGDEPAILVAVNDITQRKRSEQETDAAKQRAELALMNLRQAQESLIQAEKMASLGALVAGVAHEVNTPVGTALTGITHLADSTRRFNLIFEDNNLRRSDLQDYLAMAREACGLIETNLHRAADLIQSFKQTAVDQTSEERRRFPLAAYLHDVLTSLQPRLRKGGHQVEVDCPDDLTVDGYPGALFQVLTNLVMNALTHAYPDGRAGILRVAVVRIDDGTSELRFSDDGCGIPLAHRTRIFDPFFTTRRGSGGSGLGLHIVYNIVTKRLGGSIRVESEVGTGTTFVVRFPLTAPDERRQIPEWSA